MNAKRLQSISKQMAYVLRHAPQRAGLWLDPEGFVPTEKLLKALSKTFPDVSLADIRQVVECVDPQKQRYSIVGDDIRANYGHSTADRIEHIAIEPPAVLFHGTSEPTVVAILQQGLLPMQRQYVHLTTERTLALSVGARHGKAVLLRVDATRAHRTGVSFYRANDSFWLAEHVPPVFVVRVG